MKALTVLVIVLLGAATRAEADELLLDPRQRDEDIAGTKVFTEVTRHESGMYLYTYRVQAPEGNLGEILTFSVDLACTEAVDSLGFEPGDFPSEAQASGSEDGLHVPVAVNAAYGQSALFGVGRLNAAYWSVIARPGDERVGLSLISPYPPGGRSYRLIPSIRYGEEKWDYSGIEEDDPSIPWIDDWTVTGVTTGPACPGEEYPPGEDPEPSRFDGSLFPGQSAELNKLLSYSAPLRDQLHVDAGTRELLMTVHYGPDLDPRTFRVTPQQGLRGLFNPKPGTSETVRIPLAPGKNRIELHAQTAFTPPGQAQQAPGAPAATPAGRDPDHLDRDVFVIRVPVEDEPGARGRGRRE